MIPLITVRFYSSTDADGRGIECGPYRAVGVRDGEMRATAENLSLPRVAVQCSFGWEVCDSKDDDLWDTFSIYPHDPLHGEQPREGGES